MKVVPFIAESAADAVAQIRAQLGPNAVVLHVRQLPSNGLSRMWQKPRIEVLACVPGETGQDAEAEPQPEALMPSAPVPAGKFLDAASPSAFENPGQAPLEDNPPLPRRPHFALQSKYQPAVAATEAAAPAVAEMEALAPGVAPSPVSDPIQPTFEPAPHAVWRSAQTMENMGILPYCARKVVDQMQRRFGPIPPDSFSDEMHMLRATLRQLWPSPGAAGGESRGVSRAQYFIGAPGSGKTTCLCKMLAREVLINGRSARVWRLNGRSPNTAETLGVYCDILGVPLERTMSQEEADGGEDWLFFDLPGVDWLDNAAVEDLERQLKTLPQGDVHLVLNAAYDVTILLSQIRAFGAVPVRSLIFTHLDEENRWGKLWNFVLGTKHAVKYLSAGQNVPGDLFDASADRLLSKQFVQ